MSRDKDRYVEVDGVYWCGEEETWAAYSHLMTNCPGSHKPLYRKIAQCGNVLLRIEGSYLRCEEDEGHTKGEEFPVHSARNVNGLMVWWQSK